MTREEAKELLPIIQTWAKGKEIQFKACSGKWTDVEENEGLSFVYSSSDYRIKPEPKYRPFKNQEECWEEMHKHPDFSWVRKKITKDYCSITEIYKTRSESAIVLIKNCTYTLNEAFDVFTFTDSTPFGIKEE